MTLEGSERKTSRRSVWFAAGAAGAILALVFLHVWLLIAAELLLHQRNPAFLTTLAFFTSFLDRPGGLLEYVSAFLMQLCWWPWAGAAVITALAGLICLATRALVTVMAGRRVHPAVYFTPAVLLLMAHGQYRHPLALSVGILGALALAVLYVRRPRRRVASRLAFFAALLVLFYCVAGGVAVLFGTLCGAFEVLKKRRVAAGIIVVLLAAAAPLVAAAYSYRLGLVEACGCLLLPEERGLLPTSVLLAGQWMSHVLLMVFFPASAVLAAYGDRVGALLSRVVSRMRRRGKAGGAAVSREAHGGWTPVSFVMFLAVGAAAVLLSFDGQAATRLRLDYDASHGRWQAVLRAARGLRPEFYDPCAVHDVNLALYHTGELGDRMFSFPQAPGAPSIQLSPRQLTPIRVKKFSRFYLELGRVNVAEHWAHEALEIEGERPELLELLSRVNLLKQRRPLARTFLDALSRHLLWRGWAEDRLRRLDRSPQAADDPEIERVRSVMLKTDYPYGAFGNYTYLELMRQHLEETPHNRMAFEYMMADLLLEKRPDLVVANLHRMDAFDYPRIPTHWEEAALVFKYTRPDTAPDLSGLPIRQETEDRLTGFLADAAYHKRSSGSQKEAAFRGLARKWGGTYFFYFTYGFSEPRAGWKLRKPDTTTGATK